MESLYENIYPRYKPDRVRYKETNDCTVISFAEVWNTTYDRAHRHLKIAFNRKDRRGLAYDLCKDAVSRCKNTKMRMRSWEGKDRPTLGQFQKQHPQGRYWVFVRGHALAIIDGVIKDHSHKPRRKVIFAYRVYP